jgi:hypothetical protein
VPESLIAELDSRPPNAGSAFFQKSRIAAADNFGGMRAFYDSKVAKVGRKVYLATARRLGFIESFAGGPHTGHLLGSEIAADNFAISADDCEGAIIE